MVDLNTIELLEISQDSVLLQSVGLVAYRGDGIAHNVIRLVTRHSMTLLYALAYTIKSAVHHLFIRGDGHLSCQKEQ